MGFGGYEGLEEQFHQRNISISCFEGQAGRLVIKGVLSDERMFPSFLYSANKVCQAGFVHRIEAMLELALPSLEIIAAQAEMPVTPLAECAQLAEVIQKLVGRCIKAGFTKEVKELIGGTKGCLHLSNLIIAMASASIQGMWSHYSRIREDETLRQAPGDESTLLDSCWMWREEGDLVQRFRAARKAPRSFVVAIDGPAGSGKSTVSRILARRLGFTYLDTGALYRALALKALRERVKNDDRNALARLCQNSQIELRKQGEEMRIFLDGEDVSEEIRGEAVGMQASLLSASPIIRAALLGIQRHIAAGGDTVAEGRDAGSVVFPLAQVKVFLSADGKERARRRYQEILAKGEEADKDRILADLLARDEQDTKRGIAPLVAAPDAVIIDTSLMSIEAVVEKIATLVATQKSAATR